MQAFLLASMMFGVLPPSADAGPRVDKLIGQVLLDGETEHQGTVVTVTRLGEAPLERLDSPRGQWLSGLLGVFLLAVAVLRLRRRRGLLLTLALFLGVGFALAATLVGVSDSEGAYRIEASSGAGFFPGTYQISLIHEGYYHETRYWSLSEEEGGSGDVSLPSVTLRKVPLTEGDETLEPPESVPVLDPSVPTDFADAVEFIYEGPGRVQEGVVPGAIDRTRVAVLRGKVLGPDGSALEGVTVAIQEHPDWGATQTRASGGMELAVNGGDPLTIQFFKDGYIPVSRQIRPKALNVASLPEVCLLRYDEKVTSIDLSGASEMQVAQGSAMSDKDGVRQATLLFPSTTRARMRLPGGGVRGMSSLSVRATEFTVGPMGPQAMPADLPPTSAFTYAVELSADEAVGAGATRVDFSEPVIFYLENFLDFPAGEAVPVGYYDRGEGKWFASDNGRIVQVTDILGGMAELDIDGDGKAESSEALAKFGVTSEELMRLAGLYSAGQSLWRVPIPHFTPWDCNWPYGPPVDAEQPVASVEGDDRLDEPCFQYRSIIECQNQTLGQAIPLVGTPFSLHYQSDRVRGRKAAYSITIHLADVQPPPSVKRLELEIEVGGRIFRYQRPPPFPGDTHTFTWDGRGGFGRTQDGAQPITVRVGYVYDAVYYEPDEFEQSFGGLTDSAVSRDEAREEVTLWRSLTSTIGLLTAKSQGLGGWTLSVHHAFDPIADILYLGTGERQSISTVPVEIDTVVGAGSGEDRRGDGGEDQELNGPLDVLAASDGSLYIADTLNHRVIQVHSDGTIQTIAGTGEACLFGPDGCDVGDGGLATEAKLYFPSDLSLGADGTLYIVDWGHRRLREVTPDGLIETVLELRPTDCPCGETCDDGSPTPIGKPEAVAASPDGTLYLALPLDNEVWRIDTSGNVTTLAGDCSAAGSFGGDGGPASSALLGTPVDVEVGADGSVYILDLFNGRIRQVGADGIIRTVVQSADLPTNPLNASKLAIADDGFTFYVTETLEHVVWRFNREGTGQIIAGVVDEEGYSGDGGQATQAMLTGPSGLDVGPEGELYIADTGNSAIRRVAPPALRYSVTDTLIPDRDGSAVYIFGSDGRHKSTVHGLTGVVLYEFSYDEAGFLASITDRDGNVTHLERNQNHDLIAVVGPFGQRTAFSINDDGYIASITNSGGLRHNLAYENLGLLSEFEDPRGYSSVYQYSDMGRLERDEDVLGGFLSLAREEEDEGYTVVQNTALGRTTSYAVEDLEDGGEQRVNTSPSGLKTETHINEEESRTVTLSDGTVRHTSLNSDPRFSFLVRVLSEASIQTPAGLHFMASGTRTTVLSSPDNLLSPVSQTDRLRINSREYVSTFDAASMTSTSTSPERRQSVTTLDDKGRVKKVEVPGLAPVEYIYDERGRLETVSQIGDIRGASRSSRSGGRAALVEPRPLPPVAKDTSASTSGPPEGVSPGQESGHGRSRNRGTETRTTTYAYGADGYLDSVIDPLERVTTFETDAIGRVVSATLPGGRVVTTEYDGNSNVTEITPPGQPEHGIEYTPVDLPNQYGPPDLGEGSEATTWEYNLDRQPMKVTRPDALTIDSAYDAAGRLETLTAPHGEISLTYEEKTGNLATITAPGSEVLSFTYDGSLPLTETWTGTVSGSVERVFDNNFRVTSQTVNVAQAVALGYDQDGLLTSAGNLTLSRDAQNGLLTGTTLSDVTDSFEYSAFGEVEKYTAAFESADIFVVDYERDKLGRITKKTETIDAVTSAYEYFYDLAGRLETVEKNDLVVAEYTYDENGNRLTRTTPQGTETGFHDDQDRLLSYGEWTYSYSTNGELESKTDTQTSETTLYQYDVFGNLRQVDLPDGRVVSYVIDGLNRRVGKKVDGVLQKGWLYDGQLNVVAELDGAGEVVSRFLPGGVVRDGVLYRIIRDHLGSPRLVVNATTGEIVQSMAFDEWGNVLEDTNPGFQPFGFAGGLWDSDTGLVRFGARDYSPDVGRWTIKDPIRFQGGDTNLYAYVGNDPINRIDPTGLRKFPEGFPPMNEPFDTLNNYWKTMQTHPQEAIRYFDERFNMPGDFIYNPEVGDYGETPPFADYSYIGLPLTLDQFWYGLPANMWHEQFHQIEESLWQKAFCSEADSESDAWDYTMKKMRESDLPAHLIESWLETRNIFYEQQWFWERW